MARKSTISLKSNAQSSNGLDTQDSKSHMNINDESDFDFRSNTKQMSKTLSSPKKATEPNQKDNEKLQENQLAIEKTP